MEYKNQYMGLPPEQKLRTTFEVDLKDISVLRSFDPKAGTLQTTASILFKKLINELKQSSLQPGDFSSYQHAISECRIVLGGVSIGPRSAPAVAPTGAVNPVAGKTPNRNVGRRAKKLALKVEGA